MGRSGDIIATARFNLLAVLGLNQPDLPNWSRARALQRRELQRLLPVIWAMNLFSAFALSSILWGSIPHWQTLGWLFALAATIGMAMLADHNARHRDGPAPRLAQHLVFMRALLAGIIWATPPALFGPSGIEEHLAVCFCLGGMIASAPITMSSTPLPMIGFVLPISIGLTVMMSRSGSPVLALLPTIYAGSLIMAGLAGSRATLRRRLTELALEEEMGLVSLLLHESEGDDADWLWEIDVRKRLFGVSPRLARAFAAPAEMLEARPLIQLLSDGWSGGGAPPAELRVLLDRLDARHSFRDHVLPVMINGEGRWWRLSATPRYDADGRFDGFRGVGTDVTEQHRSLRRIDRLARFDGLTGIANRMSITERLRTAIEATNAGGRPCALVLIDLDRFKAVNDTYGHPTGDRLLRAAARRLAGLIGQGDLCGRLGGDEFAVLIGDATGPDRLDTLCRRICETLSEPFEIDGHLLQVGTSIGTATAPGDGANAETLMRHADLALYRAKRTGRGHHCHFEPILLDSAERRLGIERALRDALARDEMHLLYQPVVAIADGSVAGFEALLRWDHPELGAIPPDEFVPIADAARMMAPIGEWVLHEACHAATRWPAHVHLSINLTSSQALDPTLPMVIRSALAISGLSPERLALEISESALVEGGDPLTDAIDRLRETGVRLVLDDFGTGFGHIRQARFTTVKLARSSMPAPESAAADRVALIRALVTMADALGLETVAKGAETDRERALAALLGCHHVQGRISGPPLTPEAARRLVAGDAPDLRRVA